jgi:hypothetical protein
MMKYFMQGDIKKLTWSAPLFNNAKSIVHAWVGQKVMYINLLVRQN